MHQALESAIQANENRDNRTNLLGGYEEAGPNETEQGLLDYATNKEDETTDTAHNILRMTQEAKEVGTATLNKMNKQLEQMDEIMNEMVGMGDDIKQGRRILRRFARKQTSSRCFAILTFLFLAAICAVLASVIFGNGDLGTNDEALNSL